jgi:hypothetical protein
MGEIWIKPIASSSYQCYIWLNSWALFLSGGSFITELTPDDNYINVIIQEATPTTAKPGWLWIKESTMTAYLYIFDFVPLIGA